jgi:MFS family permease
MASGLFNTFVSVRLEMEGYEPEMIGIVTSGLYVGILLGSIWIGRWIQKMGHIRSFVVFALGSMVVVLGQSFWINPWFWVALRLIGGIFMAGIFIVIESWLLLQSTSKTRGAILSVYLGVFYGALSLGQFLINLSDPMSATPFYITAFLCAVSVLPILLKKICEPKLEEEAPLSMGQLFRLSPLGFVGGVVSGMVLAAIYGLVPVYAKEMGFSVAEIGNLMAMIIFGGLCMQWPMGYWADQGNRRTTLNTASFLSALFGIALALLPSSSPYTLPLAWAFGGFAFTLYPLSMAYTCEKVSENQIVAATGGFVLSYGIGAIGGPLLAPLVMEWLGSVGLFYFLAAISLFLGLFGLKKPALEIKPAPQENEDL